MTAGLISVTLLLGAVVLALAGPWLLRSAAPALMRIPRATVLLLPAVIAIWLGAVLAIGPMLAWSGSGPALIPESAALVCQRCLVAANPLAIGTTDTAVPSLLLLLVPVVLVVGLGIGALGALVRRARRSRAAARSLRACARTRTIAGHPVSVIESDHPVAMALPGRHGGIVVSTAALDRLTDDELSAVIAHERAHVEEHHHAILALVESVAAYLRWIPLVRSIADSLPHYVEIAADKRARAAAGTPALVGALLALGDRDASDAPGFAAALHANGPHRIREIVQPSSGAAGALSAGLIAVGLSALALVAALVHVPYVLAVLGGCA
ncbi:Peptidase M48, Ste24p precursor [Actinomycetales bacterium JB111]|nr:Peptidase M48, Ste24p precursor [Actinomycetales bacterium JB111]